LGKKFWVAVQMESWSAKNNGQPRQLAFTHTSKLQREAEEYRAVFARAGKNKAVQLVGAGSMLPQRKFSNVPPCQNSFKKAPNVNTY
jgi:hypothetical protein